MEKYNKILTLSAINSAGKSATKSATKNAHLIK